MLAHRAPLHVQEILASLSLTTPRRLDYGTISLFYDPRSPHTPLLPSFNVALIPEWYFERYAQFVTRTEPEAAGRATLLGLEDGRRLFLSARVDQAQLRPFLEDVAAFGGSVSIRRYTGDRLEVEVEMPRDGFVTFVDNWDPDWRAFVDERPAPLLVPFGTFKAVAVPAGAHRVAFSYEPWPFASLR